MSKIGIIIQREYITRVRNKSFILSTFLLPVMMILFILGSVFFAVKSVEKQSVAVVNDPGYFQKHLRSDSSQVVFSYPSGVDSLNYANKGYDGVLYLPAQPGQQPYELVSRKQFGIAARGHIEKQLNKAIENHLLGLVVGDKKKFTVEAADGFGERQTGLIQFRQRHEFPSDMEISEGVIIVFTLPNGAEMPGVVREINGDSITIDFNHPLAGKALTFDLEVVAINP